MVKRDEFERRTGVDRRIKLVGVGSSLDRPAGTIPNVPVLEQVITSLEHHCYCSLTSDWLNKLLADELVPNPEYADLVKRIKVKWKDAGKPGGFFIVRACELGLCREKSILEKKEGEVKP